MRRRRFKTNWHLLTRHPLVFARAYRWALLVLLIGAVLDGVTTYRNVCLYGPESEMHPGGWMVLSILGPGWGTLVTKLGQVAAAIVVASLWRPWCRWLMVLAGVLYAAAAVSNHYGLL